MNLDSMVFEVTDVPTVTQSLQRVSDLLNQLKIIQLFEGLALPGLILDFFFNSRSKPLIEVIPANSK